MKLNKAEKIIKNIFDEYKDVIIDNLGLRLKILNKLEEILPAFKAGKPLPPEYFQALNKFVPS